MCLCVCQREKLDIFFCPVTRERSTVTELPETRWESLPLPLWVRVSFFFNPGRKTPTSGEADGELSTLNKKLLGALHPFAFTKTSSTCWFENCEYFMLFQLSVCQETVTASKWNISCSPNFCLFRDVSVPRDVEFAFYAVDLSSRLTKFSFEGYALLK